MTQQHRDAREKPNPELERLAQEGRAARANAASSTTDEAKAAGERHLREALATLHGAPKNVAVKAAGGLCLMAALLMIALHQTVPAPVGIATLALGIILTVSGGIMSPQASDSAVEDERQWSHSLPFAFEGYFEVLAAKPRSVGGVRTHITWGPEVGAVDEQLLADIFAAMDPGSQLEHADTSGVVLASGPISGETGARINREPVVRNHAYPEYIHNLSAKVLVPLSRSYAIESVRLEAI